MLEPVEATTRGVDDFDKREIEGAREPLGAFLNFASRKRTN